MIWTFYLTGFILTFVLTLCRLKKGCKQKLCIVEILFGVLVALFSWVGFLALMLGGSFKHCMSEETNEGHMFGVDQGKFLEEEENDKKK